ncbi:GntR family transcriptional regulator [Pontibacillus halophilus JSM 076056 = DSM 19796]|uniref:GntR family transcriptional regulator n=1 Tax=Pontibacillus halophilus JSM 076056 = DSM 19796 TaxID=1385510 RepID=A0A0A5GK51_9BACI|nr:GntR family transcriptional regulator [Pontibacillus halophilus]KGX92384.1 GntR family transcriptional regulator [Pontibacillus halophilus JSM 076056 = DSM 19796]
MFELDLRSRKPLYEQLVEKFKEFIFSGIMEPDEKLPSVRTLSQQLTINPNTIQKAYRELEMQGYIYSVKGKGSFVNHTVEQVDTARLQEIRSELKKLLAEALYMGMSPSEMREIIQEIEAEGSEHHD